MLERLLQRSAILITATALAAGVACHSPTAPSLSTQSNTSGNAESGQQTPLANEDTTFSGAGDIAHQAFLANAQATANLLKGVPGPKFTLGDNVQANGTIDEYLNWFSPTWGALLNDLHPVPGNHDATNAYYEFFGSRAGPYGKGFYSFNLGSSWKVLALNSNLPSGPGSEQYNFVRSELQDPRPCAIIYYHHSIESNVEDDGRMKPIFKLAYENGAEIAMGGHYHIYQNIAPKDGDLRPDQRFGIRQFVAGTGGYALYQKNKDVPGTQSFDNQDHGVLVLHLLAGKYRWEFQTVNRGTIDMGEDTCHSAPSSSEMISMRK